MATESISFSNQKPIEKKITVEDMYLFGKVLKGVRASRPEKKTIKRISAETGFSESSIANWESGDTLPEEEKLKAMAKAYDVSLRQLTEAFKTSKEARELANDARSGKVFSHSKN